MSMKMSDTLSMGCCKGGRVFASPLARRLAKQSGIDLTLVSGSGAHGRIIQRDIEKMRQAGGMVANAVSAMSPVSDSSVLSLFNAEEYKVIPHTSMRKTIARRLVESKQNVPHFYVSVDCDIGALLKLRSEFNAAASQIKKGESYVPEYRVSVNDMVIKAVALSLKRLPEVNASWLDSGVVRHKHSDIAVAVSIKGGVITPVIRHAEEKSLAVISNEAKDLIKRAQKMMLKPEEYQGGTGCVSNMGMFGVKSFSAIVNPPHATIFAVGAGEKRAVVRNGALAVGDIMSVTISADHRIVDGALAAELAQNFKAIIENPLAMLI